MLQPLILDIRSSAEYAQGHLPDAILVPSAPPPDTDWGITRRYLDAILGGKVFDTPIYVYCAKGRRSQVAAQILRQMGFHSVHDMGGVEEGVLAGELARGQRQLVK